MNFLIPSESVEKPCSDVLAYPLQCFQELFLATPNVAATVGGFAVAVLIWGAIFTLAIYLLLYVLRFINRGLSYFFTQTKPGQALASFACRYGGKLCCRARQVGKGDGGHSKKLISTQAIGDFGANIVSKVHVDSKWFKSAFKHVTFNNKSSDSSQTETQASQGSPVKSPQRSTSRISALTPKLLSPKSKQQ